MDRLRSIETFLLIAELGSFSEASRSLNISGSSISKYISELEADLGARLFDRTTRNVRLTEAGQVYHDNCQKVIRDLAEADASVASFQAVAQGRLQIGAPMSFGVKHLAPLLPEFLDSYPAINVNLMLDDRFVNGLDLGYDVLIRISEFTDTSMVARKLAKCRHVICASPAYLAKHGVPQHFDELAHHNCLNYSNLLATKEWQGVRGDERVSLQAQGRLSVNNGDALRLLCLAGQGVALLPTFIIGEDLAAGKLVSLLKDYKLRELILHAVYPHRQHIPLKLRVFIDFLARHFKESPYWDR